MIQRIKYKIKVLRADPHMQEVVRGTMLSFLLKIAGSGLAFGFSVAVARLLGAEGAGLYFLALSITVIGSVIGRMGLDNALLRFVATHAAHGESGRVQAVHALGMKLAVMVSGILSLVGFFTAGWMAEDLFRKLELAEPLRWMSLSILPFAILNLQAESLKGLKKVRDAMLLQSIGVPLIGLLLIWPLASIYAVEGVSWSYLAATILVALYGVWVWGNSKVDKVESVPCYHLTDLWMSAKPLFITSVMNISLIWLPMLLLGMWASAAEVGIFGAATRLTQLVSFLLVSLNNVVAPKFAELHALNDLHSMGQLARRTAAILVVLASPLFFLLFTFSGETMALFGPKFAEGGTILVILLVGQVVNVITGSVGFLLMMSGNEKTIRNIAIVSALIQLVLVLMLAPLIGAIGAAIASATAMAVMHLVSVFAAYRKLGLCTIPGMHLLLRETR